MLRQLQGLGFQAFGQQVVLQLARRASICSAVGRSRAPNSSQSAAALR
jgi:hypothetical protein